MSKSFIALLVVLLALLVQEAAYLFIGYQHEHRAQYPAFAITPIDPNRKVRSIARTPEMTQAFSVVSEVIQEAQRKSVALNDAVELRFYASKSKKHLADAPEFWPVCDSLQLFRYNSDMTVTPIGDKRMLPPNVVFSPDEFNGQFDEKKGLIFVDVEAHSGGNLVFIQTNITPQIPKLDRMLTFLDGKVYEDGGDDIRENVHWQIQVGYYLEADSPAVRP